MTKPQTPQGHLHPQGPRRDAPLLRHPAGRPHLRGRPDGLQRQLGDGAVCHRRERDHGAVRAAVAGAHLPGGRAAAGDKVR